MATAIATFVLGGGLVALIRIIIDWRKYPLDKKTAQVDHSEKTVNMALNTLTAVHTQYQEVLDRQDDLAREVEDLKIQFQAQKTLVSKLKDYIIYLYDNWESIRHKPNPPKLTTDIQTHIFKEDEE